MNKNLARIPALFFLLMSCHNGYETGRKPYSSMFRHDPELKLSNRDSLIQCREKPNLMLFCPMRSHPIHKPPDRFLYNYTYLHSTHEMRKQRLIWARALGCNPIMCNNHVFVEKKCYDHVHYNSLGGGLSVGDYPEEKSYPMNHVYEESCRRIFQRDLNRLNKERKDMYYYNAYHGR